MERNLASHDDGAFAVDAVRDDSLLPALRAEWEALHRRGLNAGPFVAFDWIARCWERHRAVGQRRLDIITVRRDGRLVLLAPLTSRRGALGFRVLEWLDSLTPCYGDLLMEDSADGRHAAELLTARLTRDPSIRRIRLNMVTGDAAAHPFLHAAKARIRSSTTVLRVNLTEPDGWEGFLRRLGYKSRQNFRRYLRLIERAGPAVFEAVTAADDIVETVDRIFAWKTAVLGSKGIQSGWLDAPESQSLFRDVALAGPSTGLATVYRLRAGSAVLAACLVLRSGRGMFFSKTAYDPQFSTLSAGSVMRVLFIRHAFEAGTRSIDLMTGEHDWKRHLPTEEVACANYRIPGRLFRLGGG